MRIAVVQGPNLNRLGKRRPDKYGLDTLADISAMIEEAAAGLGVEVVQFQSNHEGALIDFIHEHQDSLDGLIVNPAGLTSYGYSLLDTVRDVGRPFAIVHISSFWALDGKERSDIFADSAAVHITGAGARGYVAALEAIVTKSRLQSAS
jgi:3-dehydroquinate dehydratase-2